VKDRRKTPPPEPLPPEFEKSGKEGAAGIPGAHLLRDPRTGIYTMVALLEFIRYEIDGGTQTERNEQFVSPLCIAAISLDALPALKDEAARTRVVEASGEAIKRITRRSDRLARHGSDFVVLLRRTLAKRAREFYAPNVAGAVAEYTREASCFTTLTIGISSLTEHLIRDPNDMVKKAFVALDFAKKQGPGSMRIFDLREMT
jgi:GGDEF domain-containing protein